MVAVGRIEEESDAEERDGDRNSNVNPLMFSNTEGGESCEPN